MGCPTLGTHQEPEYTRAQAYNDESLIDLETVEEALQAARHLEELLDSIEDDTMLSHLRNLAFIIEELSRIKLEN